MITEIFTTNNILFILFFLYYTDFLSNLLYISNVFNYLNDENKKEHKQTEELKTVSPPKYEDKYLDQVLKITTEKTKELEEEQDQQQKEKILEGLTNSFIIEKTPLGNVAMYYNIKRESFTYFSDSTIPYRFLEVVARKYVLTFRCTDLYIIMEEELKKYEKKLEELEKQAEEEKNLNTNDSSSTKVAKKNVFAKFKTYNKEAGTGRVNKAPPPKNSIPQSKKLDSSDNSEKVILKENANRYTYEGRFSNFNPLKKIDRKQIDKKYAMSFAEFKKMQKKQII
jgi:hypothetical protein